MSAETIGLMVLAQAGLGVLHRLTGVIAEHQGDITSVEILENSDEDARIYFEIALPSPVADLERDLRNLAIVKTVEAVKSFQRIYGKRIIIVGGGAQVGQVAIGAISEADRHNIRGEHISVDTIPLVGEQPLADAVRAVARLPRAKALVLAGALMGGDIELAVREVRRSGLLVISLNMAGSVPEAADLVVTATGLKLQVLSGLEITVDGASVDPAKCFTYKGMMYSDVPNFASSFGYTNASWTLKSDLTCAYVCRLLNHMEKAGARRCTPRVRYPDMAAGAWVDFSSGYFQRSLDKLPKQGSRKPWKLHQNYVRDLVAMKFAPVDDGAMEFSR